MIHFTPNPLSRARCAHGRRGAPAKLLIFLALLLPLTVYSQETGTLTDTRDGHSYRTVKIGSQTWMAENLALLPAVDRIGTGLFEEQCHYVYGYDGVNVEEAKSNPNYKIYGVLYNWIAARAACPDGWHLPTDLEWIQLEKQLEMSDQDAFMRDYRSSGKVGQKLKAASGWIDGNGTDQVGFAALPGGCRGYGGCESKGFAGFFWTSSTIDGDNGWRRAMSSDNHGIARQEDRRYFGCSVRCIKN